MLIRHRYLFFLVLAAVIVADKEDWYQMNTEYGFITMDPDGWAKPVLDTTLKATLFKDLPWEGNTYIMVMSGSSMGSYLGYRDGTRIGAYSNWENARYVNWQNCTLMKGDKPMLYSPSGQFFFDKSTPQYPKVCVTKIYPNRPQVCTATDVSGSWKYMFTIPGKTTRTITHGTTKRHQESKTQEWSHSVSVAIETSLTIKGVFTLGTRTGYEFRNMIATQYSDEWSSNNEESWTIEFSDGDKGKALWQFVFKIQDSCAHEESTLLQEYAITPSKVQPPCCLPGYAHDAPRYSNCTSQEALIENDKKRCTVALEKRHLLRYMY